MELTVADAIKALTGKQIEAANVLQNVVIDSRQVVDGSLFVALPGEKTDGHQYVAQAFHQGAVAAITQQPIEGYQAISADTSSDELAAITSQGTFCLQVNDSLQGLQQLAAFWRQKFTPRVIGITGSIGKSTSKELLWNVLSRRYNTLKNEGNYNNEIGLPLTLLNLTAEHERVVLEMGMYALGEIELLCKLAKPQVGVITNVGPVHLERLGTIERIAQAKAELVAALPPSTEGGVAILNYDDPLVLPMRQETKAQVVTYGLSPEADLWASDVESAGLEGIRFTLHHQGEDIHVRVPLLGRHSVHTALRAALGGLVEGLDWADIVAGLQTLPSTAQLRLVAVSGPNGAILLDDSYNASPTSTFAALNLLEELAASRKIAVLGDMMELGSFEEEGHRKVGCRAAGVLDILITIGTRAKIMAEEAQACGLPSDMVIELKDNQTAIDTLKAMLESDDVVLIKGSNSQHMGEIVSALTVPKSSKSEPNVNPA